MRLARLRRFSSSSASFGSESSTSASSSSVPPAGTAEEHSKWFLSKLSKSISRVDQQDPLSRAKALDPAEIVELDYMSMCGLRSSELPTELRSKIFELLNQFGFKGDLERFGKYMVAKYRSRSCTETPRVLPSSLDLTVSKPSPIDRLMKSKGFTELRDLVDSPEVRSEEAVNFALDEVKNFQMFYSPGMAVTYIAHRFPGTFGVNFRIMTEILKRVPNFNPKSFLDYGSGPGVSVLAALQVWGDATDLDITCIEPSMNMQKIGKYLLSDILGKVSWYVTLSSRGNHDLITLSYVLMEIRDEPSRLLLVRNLVSQLSEGGILAIVDCGTPMGFRFLHAIRTHIIQEGGYHIVAPCPHEKACPMAQTGRDWCHFDQSIVRLPPSVYAKGKKSNNIDYEKFSYLVLRKGDGPRKKFQTESLAPSSWEKSYFWPRLVMPAIKAGGHTVMDVCSNAPTLERLVVSKSQSHASGFRFSRKLMWGDLWRYPKRLIRVDARESFDRKSHTDKLQESVRKTLEEIRNEKFENEQKLDHIYYGS